MIAYLIVMSVSVFIGFILCAYAGKDRPPNDKACQCYYDADGERKWPGENCPVHKKKAAPPR